MKYCKKLFALLAAALLCMALTLPAGAAAPLVRDECGVFDSDTLADLEEQAESASDGHDVDVYFLVVDDIGDADQRDYAKNYYISNGLGYGDEQSGILFLLAVGSRKYVTITYGEGVTAFTDYRIEQQEDEIVPQLSDEEWADAAYTYIDMCDDALDYYADYGEPIDVDKRYRPGRPAHCHDLPSRHFGVHLPHPLPPDEDGPAEDGGRRVYARLHPAGQA